MNPRPKPLADRATLAPKLSQLPRILFRRRQDPEERQLPKGLATIVPLTRPKEASVLPIIESKFSGHPVHKKPPIDHAPLPPMPPLLHRLPGRIVQSNVKHPAVFLTVPKFTIHRMSHRVRIVKLACALQPPNPDLILHDRTLRRSPKQTVQMRRPSPTAEHPRLILNPPLHPPTVLDTMPIPPLQNRRPFRI
jgi:hypothetical protein